MGTTFEGGLNASLLRCWCSVAAPRNGSLQGGFGEGHKTSLGEGVLGSLPQVDSLLLRLGQGAFGRAPRGRALFPGSVERP